MSKSYRILILGASYGSLLGTKLALAGHAVTLICLPAEAEAINRDGARVRLPVRGHAPVELDSRDAPGKLAAAGPAAVNPKDFDLVALAGEKRDIGLKLALERDVRLVRFEDGRLEFAPAQGAAPQLAADISRKVSEWTGRRWIVVVSKEEGAPSLRAQAEADKAELERGVQADPLVQAVLNRFPGAKIVGVTQAAPEEPAADAGPEESED